MKSCGKVWLTVLLCVVPLALVVAAPSQSVAQEFVYISNFGDGTISGFAVNAVDGRLTHVPGSPFGAGVGPGPLAHSLDGQFLYVALLEWYQGGPCGTNFSELLAYSIEPTNGRLWPLQAVPLPGYCASDAIVDPSGQFLYVALINFSSNKYGEIAAYKISSGTLTAVPGSPFPSPIALPPGQGAAIVSLAISEDGKTLYGSDPIDAAGILIFDRNPNTGELLYRDSFNSETTFSPMAMTPSGKFLLAMPSSGNELYEYAIGAYGDLMEVPGSPFTSPNTNIANGIAVSPNGDFIAIAEQGGITVQRTAPANGSLSIVPGSPFGSGVPSAITFDPSGNFVYVPGTAYKINSQTGVLTEVSTFETGSSPEAITAVKP
jgi:6-phosphogluconolactonase (cycloisomerase 2 family)